MDILQVTPRYPPSVGGIQRHVQELSENLTAMGHGVTIVTTGNLNDDSSVNSVAIERVPAYSSYLFSPSVTTAVQNSDPDIVHAHGYHSLTAFFARLGIGSTPFVFTPHYLGRRGSLFRKTLLLGYHLLGKSIFRRADLVIAVSAWEQQLIEDHFGVSSSVIPNGTAIDRFANASPWDHERPYVFCLGRLEEYKGIQHVVRSLPHLEYDLLVAGTGPYSEELVSLAESVGVADQLHLLGYVEDDKIPNLYAGAAVHVTLSEFECFGLTVAESLAAGTPCVVRELTALREWVDVTGCLGIERTDPTIVADAINEVSTVTPDRSELFSWADMTKQVEEAYDSVIG